MSEFINSNGGILVRCMEAINGFKRKYGVWPSHLHLNPEVHYVLIACHLTEKGYIHLCNFLTIVSEVGADIKAAGPDNRIFDYSTESWPEEIQCDVNIQKILGF